MDKASSLQIETMEVLLRYMQEKELSVEWTVYSDIGPGWIGGSRTICFYLDEHPLHDNSFHERLQRSVIAFANIPETGGENMIYGEGQVSAKNGRLYLSYRWDSAPPYLESVESGHGQGELVF